MTGKTDPGNERMKPTELDDSQLGQVTGGARTAIKPAAPRPVPLPYPN